MAFSIFFSSTYAEIIRVAEQAVWSEVRTPMTLSKILNQGLVLKKSQKHAFVILRSTYIRKAARYHLRKIRPKKTLKVSWVKISSRRSKVFRFLD